MTLVNVNVYQGISLVWTGISLPVQWELLLLEGLKEIKYVVHAPSSVLSFVKVTALIPVSDENDSFLLSTVN